MFFIQRLLAHEKTIVLNGIMCRALCSDNNDTSNNRSNNKYYGVLPE